MKFKYRADIDGLRAVAVLSVLVFHLNSEWVTGGFVGVDVFFVISGYLITNIIVREAEAKQFSFSKFYERRIRRIFPALFVMMAFSAVMAYLMLPRAEFRAFFDDFKFASAQISNFRFAREVDYMAVGVEASPLLHTWSLAVEEQFYVVWPLFILGVLAVTCRKWLNVSMFAVVALSLATCVYLLKNNDGANAFYMFYARAYELAIGAIVALHLLPKLNKKWAVNGLSILGLGMILFAVFAYTKQTLFPGFSALLPSLGAAILIYAGSQHQGIVQKLLSVKAVVGVGLISYSLYLWHWPLIVYYKNFTLKELNITEGVVIGLVSVAVAYLSYRYVETPFRKPKNKISNKKLFSYTFLLVVVCMVGAHQMTVHENKLWGRSKDKSVYDNYYEKYFKEINPYHTKCKTGEKNFKIQDACSIIGDPERTQFDALVIGDSHAMHYAPAIEFWALKNKRNAYFVARGACPMFLREDYVINDERKGDLKCTVAREHILNIIKEREVTQIIYGHLQNPIVANKRYIELNGKRNGTENYFKLWKNEVAKNHELGLRTTFLHQVPEYNISFKKCYQMHLGTILASLKLGDLSTCLEEMKPINVSSGDKAIELFNELSEKYPSFNVFYPAPYLPKPMGENGDFYYTDTHHINIYGANKLAPHVTQFLEEIEPKL